jgi:hypothetical protein
MNRDGVTCGDCLVNGYLVLLVVGLVLSVIAVVLAPPY